MAVTGDFRKLKDLGRRLERASLVARVRVNGALAGAAQEQVAQAFMEGRDPWGRKWKPITHRQGQPLRDTGRLMNSFHVAHGPWGFTIASGVVYAAIHNFGGTVRVPERLMGRRRSGAFGRRGRRGTVASSWTRAHSATIPARPFIPSPDNLGPRWLRALREAADEALHEVLR